jgi:magnesium chelatase family protein
MCSTDQINHYWRKLGGALLDRIELRVPVLPEDFDTMVSAKDETTSTGEEARAIKERVARAVTAQREREKTTGIRRNAALTPSHIENLAALSDPAKAVFKKAVEKLDLSGRAYHGVLRVARTIADLEGQDAISSNHILEAVCHRRYGDDPFDIFSVESN